MMTDKQVVADLGKVDRDLKERYGAYASYYDSSVAPGHVDYYGETPSHEEVGRLLDVYAGPDTRALDLGCGAGFETCRLGAKVAEVWGFDMEPQLLDAARLRVKALGLSNVTLVEGNVAVAAELAMLPEARFDLVWSQRGPSLNEDLMRVLHPDAMVVQELVIGTDSFPIREIFGRRAHVPYATGPDGLLQHYADLGLLPVSVKEYAYDEFYRDADHLETALRRGLFLIDWRVPSPGGYEPGRDRSALDLYVRYNATDRGVRIARRRAVFVFRRAAVHYYPADGVPRSERSGPSAG